MSGKRLGDAPAQTTINVPDVPAPKGWVSLGERFLYRPGPPGEPVPGFMKNRSGQEVAHCGHVPVQGYIVDMKTYESPKFGADFSQIAICLTAPCIGIDGDLHKELKAGDILVVTETAALRILEPVCRHPHLTAEVWIKPGGVRPIPGTPGHTMRLWERKMAPQAVRRATLEMPNLGVFELSDVDMPKELQGDISKSLPQNAG